MTPRMKWGAVLFVALSTLAFGSVIAKTGLLRKGWLGKPATLSFTLTPDLPFTVVVEQKDVNLTRTYPGTELLSLPEGDYLVELVPASTAYQPKKLRIHLVGRQVLALPVVLRPTIAVLPAPVPDPTFASRTIDTAVWNGTGKFACASHPSGAEIWIDGKDTGLRTPLAISKALQLPSGMHRVVFRLNGKASRATEIKIEADQTSVLKGVVIPGA